ncbi:bifunctional adenosylcobinamide kinase/adenosylcobinamide-phosphate guanylyltransferase [Halodesulfovibrio sp.]|jgi:adenosylcobinamide kinase/adenosylcobinamide-phosphate guanylyltransferase|uniref:bifunctional adenosylcobinamide kinase/adenosylcobinamide-phosphate guanylyltransferase n=1 Tax=Halodesulfovibrio sp. TaxID=1912772 RepID=UPI0025F48E99|nr:bifunctional adenosylcobinamide kinase/adenosylcobinamide-phosphate guanylyltransferase [Halodesulfovibrio sp.]MCT4535021.1 bifunctional adenosylcobinamide kinase/adenosylcobinamide-phosphate guanylyltransferase [Halodesulfovibrio sp.]MCT4626138.1 bifunctional adenosylcobinamide kinase/adenosylcobinamide-phosphate guanylyltransferase [Halodesulfovibrio sp.]
MIRLILGGDKSGKSDFGLQQLYNGDEPSVLLATGHAQDFAFGQQILDHRLARIPELPVKETGIALPQLLEKAILEYRSILIDSLDFWVFACHGQWQQSQQALLHSLSLVPAECQLTIVSCEAGLGPIAASSQVRQFIRRLGALNQAVAAVSDEVCLMVAGLPLYVKKA